MGGKSPEEQKIVALTAELNKLKGNLRLSTPLQGKVTPNSTEASSTPTSSKKKNKKNKKSNKDKAGQRKDEEWKKTPPGPNEAHTKKKGEKLYHWCVHHMAWTIHKPEECRKNPVNSSTNSATSAPNVSKRDVTANTAVISNLDTLMDQLGQLQTE